MRRLAPHPLLSQTETEARILSGLPLVPRGLCDADVHFFSSSTWHFSIGLTKESTVHFGLILVWPCSNNLSLVGNTHPSLKEGKNTPLCWTRFVPSISSHALSPLTFFPLEKTTEAVAFGRSRRAIVYVNYISRPTGRRCVTRHK